MLYKYNSDMRLDKIMTIEYCLISELLLTNSWSINVGSSNMIFINDNAAILVKQSLSKYVAH